VDDDDAWFGACATGGENRLAVRIGHVEAVKRHQHLHRRRFGQAGTSKKRREVTVGKDELPGQRIVVLVEGSAGGDDSKRHGRLRGVYVADTRPGQARCCVRLAGLRGARALDQLLPAVVIMRPGAFGQLVQMA